MKNSSYASFTSVNKAQRKQKRLQWAEKYDFEGNCWGRDLLCSPSTTQHNFCFFEIDKNVFILRRMRLRENCWGRDSLFSPNTTQHNFCFFKKNKMAFLVKKSFVQNFSPNFNFLQESFAAQFSTNLAQFSTTFVFLKKQNGGANFLDIKSLRFETPWVRKNDFYESVCLSVVVGRVPRVEIVLSFLISSWVLVGPGLEFPHLEKTSRGAVSTRLVFLD